MKVNNSKKILFSGCSLTSGAGFNQLDLQSMVKDSPYLWTNIFQQSSTKYKNMEQVNISVNGSSNAEIFESTIKYLAKYGNKIDTMFCQWASMPIFNFNAGFELWETNVRSYYIPNDINLNNCTTWPKSYIDDIVNRLKVMKHLHWEILEVVNYSKIIKQLTAKLNINNVFFINGACPWDENYFIELQNVNPEQYTNFTKKEILNINNRDDQDIFKLYKLAHQHYQDAGGINKDEWINLYSSYRSQKVDVNFDNHHPGIESNKLYAQMITDRLKSLNTY
jgi:hypothetical protein